MSLNVKKIKFTKDQIPLKCPNLLILNKTITTTSSTVILGVMPDENICSNDYVKTLKIK